MVYFMSNVKGHIKIGKADKPPARVKSLQTANSEKLTLLATMSGGKKMESALHRKFHYARCHGGGRDWFHPHPNLVKFIQHVKSSAIGTLP